MMAFRSSLSETDTSLELAIVIFDIACRLHGAADGPQRVCVESTKWEKLKSRDMTLL
jgi:hypothetical protein